MTSPSARTVTLPVNPGASWDDFAWGPKYPSDDLDYRLDCADWLADAGRAIQTATISTTPGLTVVNADFGAPGTVSTGVTVQLSGGVPLTVAQVTVALMLDQGHALTVLIALPIRADLPAGLTPYVPFGAGDGTGIAIGVPGLNA